MTFPRLKAFICVLLLIGGLSLVGIWGVATIGTRLAHGSNVEHAAGVIVHIGPGMDFVLKTASGQVLDFQCAAHCRASPGHLQRHYREKAHTDVYYVDVRQGAKQILEVVDVD
ncbi:MAG TPA: hypothetical protein VKV37_23960 [Ktedonobacteraceae bacterium]|jgi:hypothetical protein|nr:hypothetical protein [Ktedonobacteraceae bacterium]